MASLTRAIAPLLATVIALGAAHADDAPVDLVPDARVDAALAAAGANRPALETALAWARAHPDPRRLPAMRFLVANMLHHGYVTTSLRDGEGRDVAFDPLAHDTFADARAELQRLEAEHGPLDFARSGFVSDLEHVSASFLERHVDAAFAAWDRTPRHRRVTWATFLEHVLPYRGSEEPIDLWMPDLLRRYAPEVHDARAARSAAEVWSWLEGEVASRVRFDERFYLHPTDQGFGEMGRSGLGRCEDITNMQTFAARSLGLAVAADFTPWWAHRDNNHAWAVLLDADGRGRDAGQAHAAKVYRKTWSLRPDALADRLPPDRKPPNRFLASRTIVDVTPQYRETFDVAVSPEGDAAKEAFAYVAVFNGGAWRAIDAAPVEDGVATFRRLGGDVVYLPCVYPADALIAAAPPFHLGADGAVERLHGTGPTTDLLLTATRPSQRSVDTGEVTPISTLVAGRTYRLDLWRDGSFVAIRTVVAGEDAIRVEGVPSDALGRLVESPSDDLERIFTIRAGRQRFH